MGQKAGSKPGQIPGGLSPEQGKSKHKAETIVSLQQDIRSGIRSAATRRQQCGLQAVRSLDVQITSCLALHGLEGPICSQEPWPHVGGLPMVELLPYCSIFGYKLWPEMVLASQVSKLRFQDQILTVWSRGIHIQTAFSQKYCTMGRSDLALPDAS